MSSLLHVFPLGAAWIQWDSGRAGRQTLLDSLAQDSRHTVLLGETRTGKTSLVFQIAVSMATDNKQVTFIRPKVLSHLPLPVHGMPTPEPTALQLVKFWYPDQTEEVVKWCGAIHTQAILPDVIIMDDFDVFAGQSKNAEHGAARLYASLIDAAAWVKEKSGDCRLILTGSQRIASLPSVSRQFHFNVVLLSGVNEEEEGACEVTSATSTYSITVRYTVGRQHIMLKSVDSRLLEKQDAT
ncbi:uncharacterized protein [Littorina saxatilis]|uniref:ATPase AAA-type core domain-containing protein n=1 Tax=Littorina saxatilis TaxID=31220 RepID=A0AAN9GHI5_9CAEN